MTVVAHVAIAAGLALAYGARALATGAEPPAFSSVQPEVLAATGALSSAFADIDGDLDLVKPE